jgi:hypothetical protein
MRRISARTACHETVRPFTAGGFRPVRRSAQAATIHADGSLSVASCSNYSPATRQCRGGSGIAYGGIYGLENASEASSPGDTIYVREFNGQYLGTKNVDRTAILPKGGTSEFNMSVIEGYQNERPLIYVMHHLNYVHLKNVILDGNNGRDVTMISGVNHSIIEGVEVRNGGGGGIYAVSNSLLLNMNVHDNGYNGKGGNSSGDPSQDQCPPVKNGWQCHGIYFEGPNVIIDGGEWHHNSGYGIHCYPDCESVSVRNAHIHNNEGTGLIFACAGNNRVENTTSESNGGVGFWLCGPNDVADHVTTYNNSSGGICTGGRGDVTIMNSITLDGIGLCQAGNSPPAVLSNNITSGGNMGDGTGL